MMSGAVKKTLAIIALVAIFVVCILVFTGVFKKSDKIPPAVKENLAGPKKEIIGQSVEGRNIEAFSYGTGTKKILFVGGMHGGYEWNSVLLAYQFVDFLDKNPSAIPTGLVVEVIPSINPDGLYKVINKEGRFDIADASTDKAILASGRFNANEVDLNRNFDCNWEPKSKWQSKTVSAGTAPFSEPETASLKKFVEKNNPSAVVFWHSQANAVYASECNDGILPKTLEIMNVYSKAAGYPSVPSFDSYKVTGDAEGWLASIGIPAITVELKTHETVEWEKNLAGIKSVLSYEGGQTNFAK